MILNIFAVRDIKTDQFANPMFLVNALQAIRHFADEVNRVDNDNILNKHADDFELYHLGTYDTNNGLFQTNTPKQIATASELKKQ